MKLLSSRNINTLIAAAAALVLMVFLLSYSEIGSPPAFNTESPIDKRPDFYLIGAHSTQFDEQGRLDITITSEHVKHNPTDDSIHLKEPRFKVFQQGLPAWNISAQSGIIYDGGDKVNLEQRVFIVSSDQQTSLKTPQLIVFPDKKRAKTDKPVTLLNANGFTRAIGMEAHLDKKEVALLNNVRGQYEPEVAPGNAE